MTICCFGDYDPAYNRTSVMLAGLRHAGAAIVECRTDKHGAIARNELARKLGDLPDVDMFLVPHSDARWLVPFLRSKKPGVFIAVDMLYALGDNWIEERGYFRRFSFTTIKLWFLDFLTIRLADAVIVENLTHGAYFARRFGSSGKKFIRAFVGADTGVFRPAARHHGAGSFIVEFHGRFFPMQGTDTIVRAAALLKDEPRISFVLIGNGQLHDETVRLSNDLGCERNISFVRWVPHAELPSYIADADVTLGLLGDFPRVYRSMPNKLFEAAAMGRITINADTPAVRELFTDGKDTALVPPGDPEALAEKIRALFGDPSLRDRMEENVSDTFNRNATPEKIGSTLLKELAARFGKPCGN